VDRTEGLVTERAAQNGRSWARWFLLALSGVHAVVLLLSAHSSPTWELGPSFWALLALNAAAIAGLVTRTRLGWVAALLCVLGAGARWGGVGIDQPGGLLALLAIAFAVFCVTDQALRREHDLAS
jgi:hypothetical protein